MPREVRKRRTPKKAKSAKDSIPRRSLHLASGSVRLKAWTCTPANCHGWVISASSDGGTNDSDLSRQILERLRNEGFATLEVDLLEQAEALDPLTRFDIPLLAERLIAASDWIRHSGKPGVSRLAYMASGNAAAAALWSSVQRGNQVAAAVSLSGRPHLAEPFLGAVSCPTLLTVEGQDARLLHTNQQAKRRLHCVSKLVAVSGVTARQKKDGRRKLTDETVDWLRTHLKQPSPRPRIFSSFMLANLGLRLKRTLLALLAFAPISMVAPPTADVTDGVKIKKGD